MKKSVFILVFVLLTCSFAFSKEGDVHVTRTGTSYFNIDIGADAYLPVSSETRVKSFGLFGAVTFTPVKIWKLAGGLKVEATVDGPFQMYFGSGSFRERLLQAHASLSGLAVFKFSLAKSFEVYAGLGGQWLVYNIKGLSSFEQTWGAVAELGGRGRLNNWFGVGAQLDFFLNRLKLRADKTGVTLRAYLTFEF